MRDLRRYLRSSSRLHNLHGQIIRTLVPTFRLVSKRLRLLKTWSLRWLHLLLLWERRGCHCVDIEEARIRRSSGSAAKLVAELVGEGLRLSCIGVLWLCRLLCVRGPVGIWCVSRLLLYLHGRLLRGWLFGKEIIIFEQIVIVSK